MGDTVKETRWGTQWERQYHMRCHPVHQLDGRLLDLAVGRVARTSQQRQHLSQFRTPSHPRHSVIQRCKSCVTFGISGGRSPLTRPFATPADFAQHDRSPFSHVHVRRERVGFVHRSRTIFCRPVPNHHVTIATFPTAARHGKSVNQNRRAAYTMKTLRIVIENGYRMSIKSKTPRHKVR
jgi:hypothetical protein